MNDTVTPHFNNMAMARGAAPNMGGGGGGYAGSAAGMGAMAMAGAALYQATQTSVGSKGTKQVDPEFHKKNQKKCRNFIIFSCVIIGTCWLIIQSWIHSQSGMFEFMGIDASPEEYRKRVIGFYEIHNPEQLVGDNHQRPVDALLWKYRYKEKKLWQKIQKKYNDPQFAEKQAAKIAAEKEKERKRKEKLATLQDDDDEDEDKTPDPKEGTAEAGASGTKKEL